MPPLCRVVVMLFLIRCRAFAARVRYASVIDIIDDIGYGAGCARYDTTGMAFMRALRALSMITTVLRCRRY